MQVTSHPKESTNPRITNCRQFALSLGKESPYIFSKIWTTKTDTPLIQTLSMAPSVSVLTGSDCANIIHLNQAVLFQQTFFNSVFVFCFFAIAAGTKG